MTRRIRRSLLRLLQWHAALKLAGKTVNWRAMFKALRTGRVDAKTYARRLRICARCPVYDRERKLCRKKVWVTHPEPKEVVVGCGCYVPFKAKTRAPYQTYLNTHRGCWGRATMGGTFGWGADDFRIEK